ncbi:hypothetical protein EFK50_12320 [Nocardioides marmoriginsengisoli]|uniref:Uncharacterized protein n=1 Tax=Nocardioides marmoriginsengisoli TaxID=661483 RepID=A0A3N0CGI0_9ACTN|nr:hypothetical protein [Nocardioides marmoriginsengisoli]RNL62547.1 hypothetical protein EFK50_12320 [Nocardioides marmoriginsengisoli]
MSESVERAWSSEREDDLEALEVLVRGVLGDIDRYEAQLPHLVVCVDLSLGDATFSGPFASYAQAQQVADHERRSVGPSSQMIFRVTPLYPPLRLAPAIDGAVGDAAVGAGER